jgi:hypothetical protein
MFRFPRAPYNLIRLHNADRIFQWQSRRGKSKSISARGMLTGHLRRGRSRGSALLLLTKTRLISFDKLDNLLVYSRSATSIYANADFLAATFAVASQSASKSDVDERVTTSGISHAMV